MPIHCPKCGLKHDVVEFSRQQSIRCRCGFHLNISMLQTVEDFLRYFEGEEERKKANVIQKNAQLICKMILDESCARVDVEIAMANLKEEVSKIFPDKIETYEMIFEARFKRLWSQFRTDEEGLDA